MFTFYVCSKSPPIIERQPFSTCHQCDTDSLQLWSIDLVCNSQCNSVLNIRITILCTISLKKTHEILIERVACEHNSSIPYREMKSVYLQARLPIEMIPSDVTITMPSPQCIAKYAHLISHHENTISTGTLHTT